MNINPINNTKYNNSFGHFEDNSVNPYSKKQKAVIATTTALGVGVASAILAKKAGYSLAPKKMFSNIKNSYLAKVKYEAKEVISIGVGSCLGGLAGGLMVDKDKNNRKAKFRESIMQIGNISIPIMTVSAFAEYGERVCSKLGNKKAALGKAGFGVLGIYAGVILANNLMNKLGDVMFKNQRGRGVKATDYSAHLDDMVVAANCVSKHPIIHAIGRIIPIALMFAGNEVGNKKS